MSIRQYLPPRHCIESYVLRTASRVEMDMGRMWMVSTAAEVDEVGDLTNGVILYDLAYACACVI